MRLAEYMEKQVLTDAWFAKRLDRDPRTIGKYRRREIMPSHKIMLKIRDLTNGEVGFDEWTLKRDDVSQNVSQVASAS